MKKEHFSREEHLFFEDADSVLHDLTEWKNLEFFFLMLFQAFSSENVLTEILFQKLFFRVWEQRKKTVKKSLKTFCLFFFYFFGRFFSVLKTERKNIFRGNSFLFPVWDKMKKNMFFHVWNQRKERKMGDKGKILGENFFLVKTPLKSKTQDRN